MSSPGIYTKVLRKGLISTERVKEEKEKQRKTWLNDLIEVCRSESGVLNVKRSLLVRIQLWNRNQSKKVKMSVLTA